MERIKLHYCYANVDGTAVAASRGNEVIEDDSIFNSTENTETTIVSEDDSLETTDKNNLSEIEELEAELQKSLDEQGWTGKAIDWVKGLFGGGSKKLKNDLEKVKNGEMDKETYLNNLNGFKDNQKNWVNNLGNFAAVGAAMAIACIPGINILGAVALGALAGGGAKFAVSFLGDEGTNKIKGDSTFEKGFDDIKSGAVTGANTVLCKTLGKKIQSRIAGTCSTYTANPFHARVGSGLLNTAAACATTSVALASTAAVTTYADSLIYEEEVSQEEYAENVLKDFLPCALGELV